MENFSSLRFGILVSQVSAHLYLLLSIDWPGLGRLFNIECAQGMNEMGFRRYIKYSNVLETSCEYEWNYL